MNKEKNYIVVIDGPAASGKSTTARMTAGKMNWIYLDTGAMYRAVTVKVIQENAALDDSALISRIVENVNIDLIPGKNGTHVLMDGKDVTDEIRTPEIDKAVGPVCEVPRVREVLVDLQREAGKNGSLVAEGRDMGTVVFPEADLKFYMIASSRARARRRHEDLKRKGIDLSLDEIEKDILRRDQRDSSRAHSPLKQAKDAVLIDTSDLSVDQQVEKVVEYIEDMINNAG